MYPSRTDLQALFAPERARRHVANGRLMRAFIGHQGPPIRAAAALLSVFARNACNAATTCAPSPTAAATRLIDPERTSPIAKTPGRLGFERALRVGALRVGAGTNEAPYRRVRCWSWPASQYWVPRRSTGTDGGSGRSVHHRRDGIGSESLAIFRHCHRARAP